MAKAHTIDDVVQSVINNYKTLLKDAVVHVAEQAKKDAEEKDLNECLAFMGLSAK